MHTLHSTHMHMPHGTHHPIYTQFNTHAQCTHIYTCIQCMSHCNPNTCHICIIYTPHLYSQTWHINILHGTTIHMHRTRQRYTHMHIPHNTQHSEYCLPHYILHTSALSRLHADARMSVHILPDSCKCTYAQIAVHTNVEHNTTLMNNMLAYSTNHTCMDTHVHHYCTHTNAHTV